MKPRTFSVAIAHEEGFYVKGSIPQMANNPGDLRLGDIGHGVMGEGITVFTDADEGWSHLDKQTGGMLSGLSRVYTPSMTLEEVGLKYSGGDPNWAKNIAQMLKVPVTITLSQMANIPEGTVG